MTKTLTRPNNVEEVTGPCVELTTEQRRLGFEWVVASDKYTKLALSKFKFPTPENIVEYRKVKTTFNSVDNALNESCGGNEACIRAAKVVGSKRNNDVSQK